VVQWGIVTDAITYSRASRKHKVKGWIFGLYHDATPMITAMTREAGENNG